MVLDNKYFERNQLKTKMEKEIKLRCYQFSLSVIRFLKTVKRDVLSSVIVKQLMRSAASVAANVIEAKNSSSRREFKRYYEIALKSCNESKYWICLLREGFEKREQVLGATLKEADEISKILAASVIKLKQTKKDNKKSRKMNNYAKYWTSIFFGFHF